MQVAGKKLPMEVDTGAAISILLETAFRKMYPRIELKQSSLVYTGEAMKVVGLFTAKIRRPSTSGHLDRVSGCVCR